MLDPTPEHPGNSDDQSVVDALDRLRREGDSARWFVVETVFERFRVNARRKRRGSRAVRRWEQTGDVLADAAIRLHMALATVRPERPGGLISLMAKKVREATLDLVRRHTGPQGYAANHRTTPPLTGGSIPAAVAAAATESSSPHELAEWAEFHEAAQNLPLDLREVWDLRFYGDWSEDAAAAALDVTTRTVRRRYRAGKLALASFLPGVPQPSSPLKTQASPVQAAERPTGEVI